MTCGIRRSNGKVQRYRLSREDILACCTEGYALGFRTFVLQGGEDAYFTEQRVCEIVSEIRERFPDCAITLSIGEWEKSSYAAFFRAGANRYLLRHETADPAHYRRLHPGAMSPEHRKRCLFDLKEIGYQVGSGFMVGSPFQTTAHLCADLRFLQELAAGYDRYWTVSHPRRHTIPDWPNGSLELTLRLIAVLRLMFPYALIPATTALGTIHPQGREMGLKAGANVVMPNLSPVSVQKAVFALCGQDLHRGRICPVPELSGTACGGGRLCHRDGYRRCAPEPEQHRTKPSGEALCGVALTAGMRCSEKICIKSICIFRKI
ncbi:[FeFe] hydrogenase H-cluster radical SAM maturase HydE [Ruminococcus sp.]|uniref:[FeFe] hydrogenase H-cluster radical SAM maturase HydE n=1 Tax=Ruminococcus sp. TaxID=41978 RepID=UPI00399189AC